jgi:hypothetical protein
MQRLKLIDGLRGYFLLFMLINHLAFQGGFWLVHVNLRELSFVEDAQGFVFLSGLLVGMVHAPKMLKWGFAKDAVKIHRRAVELYLHAIGLILGVLLVAELIPGARTFWRDWLGQLSALDHGPTISTLLLVYQPTFMDILPQYIVYMLLAPVVVWFCLKGCSGQVVVCSVLVWLTAQFGFHRPAVSVLNQWLTQSGELGLRSAFNVLAWQIVFFAGTVLGVLTAQGRIPWGAVLDPGRTALPKAALAICLLLMPLRIASAYELLPPNLLDRLAMVDDRTSFGVICLINFVAAGVGLAWLLVAGPRSNRAWIRRSAALLTGLFQLRFLRLLGRHSLQVYVWHVLVIYGVHYLDQAYGPFPQAEKVLIGGVCMALLAIPALWLERGRPKPGGGAPSRIVDPAHRAEPMAARQRTSVDEPATAESS